MKNMTPSGYEAATGIRILEVGPDKVIGEIDIDDQHRQPYGVVHGGVYCGLVETLASYGAALWAVEQGMFGAMGLGNNTDFIRATRHGTIRGEATPIHRGRSGQLWQVEVTRAGDGKLVARGQVRLHNVATHEGVPG
jgi:uncharacterized protein (TIGR00369 family)